MGTSQRRGERWSDLRDASKEARGARSLEAGLLSRRSVEDGPMLTALCACGLFTNPHVPIIDPIEALGRIASLFVGGVIFAAILRKMRK